LIIELLEIADEVVSPVLQKKNNETQK